MYYLVGISLVHSYSKEIHNLLGNQNYYLLSLDEEEFISFLKGKFFSGLNVTIPYKEISLSFLDELDEIAKKTRVVNTIINKDNKLIGYNTDYYGFEELCKRNHLNFYNKKVLVLGTGGTAKTIKIFLQNQKAKKIYLVSRHRSQFLTYQDANQIEDINFIINTTPYGMFPVLQKKSLISLDNKKSLEGCIDVIYNPMRTPLLIEAKKRGLMSISGLDMLVAQAVHTHKLFFAIKDNLEFDNIIKEILLEKSNIALIGMPFAGKTTIGKLLSEKLNYQFIDTDTEIEKKLNCSIKEYFVEHNENQFRTLEEAIISEVFQGNKKVISLGGGSILKEENLNHILRNSIVVFLDRSLSFLINNMDLNRPLVQSQKDLEELYNKRRELYLRYSDIILNSNGSQQETINEIIEKLIKK